MLEKEIPADIWCENDVVLTSMRRDHVASMLIQCHFGTKCLLGCSLGLLRVFFVNVYQYVRMFLSLLVLRVGCRIGLY